MPQHALWREDDQRLTHAPAVVSTEHLTPQHVEVLRRRGGIHHLHIVLRAELQKPFNARARMLRPLSFIAMRKQQRQTARLAPLRFRAGDKLVYKDLRTIGEIPKLRFPHDQRQRVSDAVAELETHHRILAQEAVENIEACLVRCEVAEWHVDLSILCIGILEVTLTEGAAAAVLAAEPYRRSLQYQAPEGERFAERPIYRGVL